MLPNSCASSEIIPPQLNTTFGCLYFVFSVCSQLRDLQLFGLVALENTGGNDHRVRVAFFLTVQHLLGAQRGCSGNFTPQQASIAEVHFCGMFKLLLFGQFKLAAWGLNILS